jgi:uncharacterized membrane protein YgcG
MHLEGVRASREVMIIIITLSLTIFILFLPLFLLLRSMLVREREHTNPCQGLGTGQTPRCPPSAACWPAGLPRGPPCQPRAPSPGGARSAWSIRSGGGGGGESGQGGRGREGGGEKSQLPK